MISQSGLHPSNCRLLDPLEAETTGAADGSSAVLILGFESAFAPVDEHLRLAVECAADLGGTPEPERPAGRRAPDSAAQTWRSAFLDAPYLRDSLVALGVLSETFETAITWDRFREFHSQVSEAARRAVAEVTDAPADGEGAPRVMCRFTHVYPERPRPLLHGARQGPPRLGGRAVGRDQGGGLGGDHLRRRDDHPSPRGRPRSSPLVRPAATRSASPTRSAPPRRRSIPRGCSTRAS